MKNSSLLFLLMISLIISSCGLNSDVVADRGIQKRKYRKGFFVDLGKQHQSKQLVNTASRDEQPEKMNKVNQIVEVENVSALRPTSLKKVEREIVNTQHSRVNFIETENISPVIVDSPIKRGFKSELSALTGLVVPAATAVRSDNNLLKQGLILILIGLILQLIGGFSGLLVWIGSVIALVGLIFVLVYLIRAL